MIIKLTTDYSISTIPTIHLKKNLVTTPIPCFAKMSFDTRVCRTSLSRNAKSIDSQKSDSIPEKVNRHFLKAVKEESIQIIKRLFGNALGSRIDIPPKRFSLQNEIEENAGNTLVITIVKGLYASNVRYRGRLCLLDSPSSGALTLFDIPLKGRHKKIRVSIKGKKTTREVNSILFELMKPNLLKFLEEGRRDPCFNCLDFTQFLSNRFDPKNVNTIDLAGLIAAPFNEKYLIPGSVIVLYRKEFLTLTKNGIETTKTADYFVHFAVYLDKKLYISLYGSRGPLMINTIDELKHVYGNHPVLIFHPKELNMHIPGAVNAKKNFTGYLKTIFRKV